MEREILFRSKAINRDIGYRRTKYKNGDWVYGLVTRLYDERFENLPAEMTNTYGVSGIEVDYKTIGRFTGLTDKNGRRIFEGDILKRCNHKYIVEWCDDCAMFVLPCITDEKLENDFTIFYGYEFEIIGNVHDNPELLKGE